ncbi:MAG TPA: tungsten formylmethanofuran dehydrogenase [Candidatus Atribacteria bacterium]|nr:tungsten formylmethanofuran dehydrogenase [Candidatus Atribacteria bacterium]
MVLNKVLINQEFCKGCGYCIQICPKKVLVLSESFNSHGYYPAMINDEDRCNGCGFCAQVCPEVAISVYRENEK